MATFFSPESETIETLEDVIPEETPLPKKKKGE